MYIVEKSNGSEAARWNNLHNPNWPDGSSTSGSLKPADMVREGEDGETYTVKEVLQKTEGDGPRTVSTASVAKVGDEWHQVTTMAAAAPPPPDRQGADAKAEGYDKDYADNYRDHRRTAYDAAGATIEALMVASWESAMQAEPDNAERDRINEIREAVKARFPKP